MDIKAKTLLIISFSALFVASCSSTNGRYAFGQQSASKDIKHSHSGVEHSHPLPAGHTDIRTHSHPATGTTNVNTSGTCAPCTGGATRAVVTTPVNTGVQNNGNSHVHNGRRHSHPLPASGTNHTHRVGQAQVVAPAQPAQQSNTTYYDYSSGSTATSAGVGYYNGGSKGNASGNGQTHSHGSKTHTHALPASGLNHSHNQGTTSIGNTYGNTQSQPQTGNGNTYTVQPKDTVFQVMRNTGVYWKTIIKLNNLQAPDYTIRPGQSLRLR